MKKFAIYTAVVGNYDTIRQPLAVDERFDYYLFSNDIPEERIGVWKVCPIPYNNPIQTKIARWVKTHPIELLPDYRYTIWMDGSLQIKSALFYDNIIQLSSKHIPISCRKHPDRDCVYDEAAICALWKLEREPILLDWIHVLLNKKLPHHWGLFETNILFRENTVQVQQLNNRWWNYINQYSKRDQLSFTLSLFEEDMHCECLFNGEPSVNDSPYFIWYRTHKNAQGKHLESTSRDYPFLHWYFIIHPEKENDNMMPQVRRNYERLARMHNPNLVARIIRKYYKTLHKLRKRRKDINRIDISDYANHIDGLKLNHNDFVKYTREPFLRQSSDPKVYAFYLTQFHAIPENDNAHGKGFTEWTNVANATPQFIGHFQPKIPYDLGFYNLLMPGVMERQVEIAKDYGVYGFCFYYYWFSGKKLLEKPLEYFLHSDIDFHFHLCWANENWSKRWDGGENEIIVEQHLEDGDANHFFADLLPYISDPRYERIDGKPMLIIYRPELFGKERFIQFTTQLVDLAQAHGFKGLHLLCTNVFGFDNPNEYHCDGLVEFPPHGLSVDDYLVNTPKLSPLADFSIVNMNAYLRDGLHLHNHNYPVFKTCFPEWDNTPRKLYNNGYCFLMQPTDFQRWLTDNIHWTREHHSEDEQIVYINAWNEWGEGAILEPTTHFGYRNLETLKQTIESCRL